MDSPQRIIVVANEPRHLTESNIWLTRILPFLRQLGVDPEVLFFFNHEGLGYVGEALRVAGIRCHYRRQRETERNIRDILDVVVTRRPGILIAGGNLSAYFCTPWLRQAGVPVVGLLSSEDPFHQELCEEFIEAGGPFQVDACAGVSGVLAERIRNAGLPATQCPFGAPLARVATTFSLAPFRVLCPVNFGDQQESVTQVLEAVLELIQADPRIEVSLFGNGVEPPKIREAVQSEDFEGRLRVVKAAAPSRIQDQMVKYQSVFGLPAGGGSSTALLEAMSVGLVPVVLAGQSVMDDLLSDGENGMLVKEPAGVVPAVRHLLNDESDWRRLSEAAIQSVREHYSSRRCAERWAAFLKSLTERAIDYAAMELPDPRAIELPGQREDPLGILREDRRLRSIPKSDPFINPPCALENSDLYWQRRSVLRALEQQLPLFEGDFLDLSFGSMRYKDWILARAMGQVRYLGLAMEGEPFADGADRLWDGRRIPLADDSVDGVMAIDLLGRCPEPPAVLREIRRVLRPGGFFFFTEPYLWPFRPSQEIQYRFTAFDLEALLNQSGFEDIRVAPLSGWHGSMAQIMGLWLKHAPMPAEERVAFEAKLWPLYEKLVKNETAPPDHQAEDGMATGWSGAAFAKIPERMETGISPRSLPLLIVCEGGKDHAVAAIDHHIKYLSSERILVHGWPCPRFLEDGSSILQPDLEARLSAVIGKGEPLAEPLLSAYRQSLARFIRQSKAQVALLESGRIADAWRRACEEAQLPYAVHYHGAVPFDCDGPEHGHGGDGAVLQNAALLLTSSGAGLRRLKESGVGEDRLGYVPYGVPLKQSRLAGPAAAPPFFIAVDSFVDKSGPLRIIGAFARVCEKVPEARLILVGAGPQLEDCRQWVEEQGLEPVVHFAGRQSGRAMRQLMSRCRSLVQHVSAAADPRPEPWVQTILKAGALGLPVLSTRHPWVGEIVRERSDGYLLDEADEPGLAQAMLKLATDAALAGQLGRQFRSRVEKNFSLPLAMSRLQALLLRIAEAGPGKAEQVDVSLDDLHARLTRAQTAEAAMELARQAESIPAAEFAFVAWRTAATLDRNCGPAYLAMGHRLKDLGQLEDAYLCLKEAERVGTAEERSRGDAAGLEAEAEFTSDAVRTYQARIGLSGMDAVTRPRRILMLTGSPADAEGHERSALLAKRGESLMARGHQVRALAPDAASWDEVARFEPELCLVGDVGAPALDLLTPILSRKIPVIHWLAHASPGFAAEATPQSPLYCMAGWSHAVIEGLKEKGYAPGRFACLPPGAEVHEYYRLMLPQMDRLRICYAGAMTGAKGPHTLLAAFDFLKKLKIPFSCEFAGAFNDPRYRAHFNSLIEQKDLKAAITVLDSRSEAAIAAMYARSNVFVMPSILEEPYGARQIEAQAAGLAVLRTPVGGYRDLLEDGVNGLLFKTEDAEDLARQLYILSEDQGLWQRIALQGQVDAFRHSPEGMVRALEAILDT